MEMNLSAAGIATQDQLDEIRSETAELITHILKLTINDEISPRLDLDKDPDCYRQNDVLKRFSG